MILLIEQICMDGGTQSRAQLDWIAIDEYSKAMAAGDTFPPIIVFYDGTAYWLADGFHRVRAAEGAHLDSVAADIRQGTRRDAILYSVGANSDHGVRRTNRDKRHAVEMLLSDDEWAEWPLNKIAQVCGVNVSTVSRIHQELSLAMQKIEKPAQRKVTRNGKTYTQDTTNIGKGAPPPVAPSRDLFALPDDEPPAVIVHNKDTAFMANYAEGVHLVITSPPYNVGLDYDQHNDSLGTYVPMMTHIWRECYAAMVDGGRIAVVVPFGVGRNPWVPLAARVMETMIDAGFTLRGQIIWDKGTTGNRTTWGSFRLPTNPGLRDTTECIIVAHKGDSDLAMPAEYRLRDDKGSHSAWLADSDYFMSLAQDHWKVAPESASRIGHPAPFPKELVRRLIHFYGFPGCHVADPFGGSGTVGVVAKELGCKATLFEISEQYSALAQERIYG